MHMYFSWRNIPKDSAMNPTSISRKPDPRSEEEHDHEEDFYYEEMKVPLNSQLISKCGSPLAVRPSQFSVVHHGTNPATSHRVQCQSSPGRPVAVLSKVGGGSIHVLADHIDMARPPHENPEYNKIRGGLLAQGTNVTLIQHPLTHHHRHQQPYPSVPNVSPESPLALVSSGVVATSTVTSMRPPVSNASSPIVSTIFPGWIMLFIGKKKMNLLVRTSWNLPHNT